MHVSGLIIQFQNCFDFFNFETSSNFKRSCENLWLSKVVTKKSSNRLKRLTITVLSYSYKISRERVILGVWPTAFEILL